MSSANGGAAAGAAASGAGGGGGPGGDSWPLRGKVSELLAVVVRQQGAAAYAELLPRLIEAAVGAAGQVGGWGQAGRQALGAHTWHAQFTGGTHMWQHGPGASQG